MADGRSLKDFLDFISSLGNQGLIPQNTAAGRKAAAQKVFAVLNETEWSDITKVDIDDVMVRFANKNRGKYTPDSLRSYQSRLRSSQVEFAEYCENPLSFRPKRRMKVASVKKSKAETPNGVDAEPLPEYLAPRQPEPVTHRSAVQILPIALRPDLTVQIAGLPFDLTTAEAKKIANIILAHAIET